MKPELQMYTISELHKILNKYLQTLLPLPDDEGTCFLTSRSLAQKFISPFLEWVRKEYRGGKSCE